MKTNPKEVINIAEIVNSFVRRLNQQSKEAGVAKVYEVVIKKTYQALPVQKTIVNKKEGNSVPTKKEERTLFFYLHNTETNERVVLYQGRFSPNNPAEFLTANYKKTLYLTFFYTCFAVTATTIENNIIANKLKKLEKGLGNVAVGQTPSETKA